MNYENVRSLIIQFQNSPQAERDIRYYTEKFLERIATEKQTAFKLFEELQQGKNVNIVKKIKKLLDRRKIA
jgi:hypothetical protein